MRETPFTEETHSHTANVDDSQESHTIHTDKYQKKRWPLFFQANLSGIRFNLLQFYPPMLLFGFFCISLVFYSFRELQDISANSVTVWVSVENAQKQRTLAPLHSSQVKRTP